MSGRQVDEFDDLAPTYGTCTFMVCTKYPSYLTRQRSLTSPSCGGAPVEGPISVLFPAVCSFACVRTPAVAEQGGKGWGWGAMEKKAAYGWVVAVVCFVVLMVVTPAIPQSQEYHQFADQRRMFLGIPNTLNVISNFPFLVIGIIGLILCHHGNYFRLSLEGEIWGWTCFFIGVAAVAFGSSYYHLDPNDSRLVWDRLPMTIAFTSIVAIFITERIDEKTGTASILPLLLAGFVPCIAIPIMAILMPPMYTHSSYWLWAAGFYLLAKIEEAEDKMIYGWTHHIVSGHTLKHLCAAMVPVFLTLMLAKRSVEPDRKSLLETWRISWAMVKEKRFKAESITCEYSAVSSDA
ncbi:hypothetical protein Taro_020522 [Colocasia esculenta]|uniref:Ceramidase n=1 Tax=Colocasia esculenta TaxID=4460 RepID=A0A843UWK9_COLES|nr:hypothetical protein [Colocasia esculenta]